MRERLESARTVLIRTTSAFTEADAVLNERESLHAVARQHAESAPDNDRVAAELRRVEKALEAAKVARDTAAAQRKAAAVRLVQAQSDFDSTRDGLTELRAALDAGDMTDLLIERYHEARTTYEDEAARRERSYGHQCPLSIAEVERGGVTGQQIQDARATAWIKGADEADPKSGLYEHRINLVRREGGDRRRSATLPYLSEQPLGEPAAGGVRLKGEPTMREVAARLEEQIALARRFRDFRAFKAALRVNDTPAERHRWRAGVAAERAVTKFFES